MAFTKLSIFNKSLRNLGVTTSLQSDQGTDTKIVALNTYYDTAKDQTLKDADWNFARANRSMALTESAVSTNPKFIREYERPEDCLYIREVYISKPGERLKYEPASNFLTGKEVINTDAYPANLVYTRRIDQEAFFPVDFVTVLSWHLSMLICESIGMGAKREYATKMYAFELAKAITANINECNDAEEEKDAPWIEDRG